MSVQIRLSRLGRKRLPFYRVVAADKAARRDGRFLEVIGTFNPLVSPEEAATNKPVKMKEDRLKYWISVGAQCSDTVSQIIEKEYPGYLSGIMTSRLEKLQAKRKARKASSPKKATEKKATEKKATAKK